MKTIETVIQRLGYHNSKKLFYLSEIDKCTDLSWHDKRIVRELAPYAIYVVDGRVLTVFFRVVRLRRTRRTNAAPFRGTAGACRRRGNPDPGRSRRAAASAIAGSREGAMSEGRRRQARNTGRGRAGA